jgi:hypothetical protein
MVKENAEETVICRDIMIGEKKKFVWNIEHQKQKDCYAVIFSKIDITIPPDIVCLEYEMDKAKYSYTIPYEMNVSTKLIFPGNELIQGFHVGVKAPYDRAYCFIKET